MKFQYAFAWLLTAVVSQFVDYEQLQDPETMGRTITNLITTLRDTVNFPLFVIGNHYIHFAKRQTIPHGLILVVLHKAIKCFAHMLVTPRKQDNRVTIISSLFVDGIFFAGRICVVLSITPTHIHVETDALRILWCFDVCTSYVLSCIFTEEHRRFNRRPVSSQSMQGKIYTEFYFFSVSFAPQILMFSGGVMFLYAFGCLPNPSDLKKDREALASLKLMLQTIEKHGWMEHLPALMSRQETIVARYHWYSVMFWSVLVPLPAMYLGWFVQKLCISHTDTTHLPYDTVIHQDDRDENQEEEHLQGVATMVQKYENHVMWSPYCTLFSIVLVDLSLIFFSLLQKDIDIIFMIMLTFILLWLWAETFYGRLDTFTRTLENQIFRNEDIQKMRREVKLQLLANVPFLFVCAYAVSFY